MFKVGDIVVLKFKQSVFNYRVIGMEDKSTIIIRNYRFSGNAHMSVNVSNWELDTTYYRRLKLLKLKEKICVE